MSQAKVNLEAALSTPSALIELWELDGSTIGLGSVYHFCSATSAQFQPIVFNGTTYTPLPMKADGFVYNGQGTLPKPRVTLSNINGFVSSFLLQYQQLVGATLTRRRVLARFLDAINFAPAGGQIPPWVTPDPTAAYPDEDFVINRKVVENNQIVQFELASPLDVNGVKLPKRVVMAGSCDSKFRDPRTCAYSGPPVADIANRLFTAAPYNMTLNDRGAYSPVATYNRGDYVFTTQTIPAYVGIPLYWVCQVNGTSGITPAGNASYWVANACSHTCAGCKLNYPTTPLRFGGFPGTSRAGWLPRQ